MNKVAISLEVQGENQIAALKVTARQIREGYGAGSLVLSDSDGFNTDWLGFWTSKPESWEGSQFITDILIESETELSDYDMAALVESKINDLYQNRLPKLPQMWLCVE